VSQFEIRAPARPLAGGAPLVHSPRYERRSSVRLLREADPPHGEQSHHPGCGLPLALLGAQGAEATRLSVQGAPAIRTTSPRSSSS